MSAETAAILTYSAQVLILVAAAALAAMAVRLPLPAARLHYWRVVVALCLLLPALPVLPAGGGPVATVTFEAAAAAPVVSLSHDETWAASASTAVPWIILAGIVARLLRLAAGAVRLRQLRHRSRPASLTSDLESLHQSVAPHAVVAATAELTQPVTFGWRRPIVLLPPRFETLAAEAQRAVLCHELLHVRRRDWPGIVGEELLRAVFWFHPAMWWALEQVHLSREQVVDQLVVARSPGRRAYMDALLQFADAPGAGRPAITFLRRRHLAARLRQLSKEPHMTRRRLASALVVLLFVVAGSAATVLSALPLTLPTFAAQGGTSLEVRLAETEPAPGLREVALDGSDRRVYLRPDAVVTGADVTSARVADAGGQYSISVTFSTPASNRLAEATRSHIGRPVAILLDGRVLSAPILRSIIRGSAVITGDFTRAQAERIAAGLAPRGPAAAAAAQRPFTSQEPGVMLPRPITQLKPQYTAAAMDAGIEGDVELEAVVEADGTVGDVTVTKSLDTVYGLDDAAIDAVKLWTFSPGTKDGQPVDVLVHMNMRFTLK